MWPVLLSIFSLNLTSNRLYRVLPSLSGFHLVFIGFDWLLSTVEYFFFDQVAWLVYMARFVVDLVVELDLE